jgi:hypothetical protein
MNRRARLPHLAVVGWLLSYPLSALALGIALFSLFGIADPSGTQMADDGDPFAPPASRWTFGLTFFGAVLVLALVRLRRRRATD